jgi:hypothetical protein
VLGAGMGEEGRGHGHTCIILVKRRT